MTADPRAECLALIPARGGSKGVPRKNLIDILGRPLISYAIEQARAAALVTRVIVSTDNDEIARVAQEWGAEVPFRRPAELAGDLSPDIDAFRHALLWLRDREGYEPELVVHLRATGPVRRVELIDRAIQTLLDHPEADSLRSVSPASQTPYKMWHLTDGYLRPVVHVEGLPDAQSMPRQMLPQVYWQNGYVDVVRPRAILDMGMMTGRVVLPFVVNEPRYEIDYLDDVPVVEDALRRLARGEMLERPDTGDRHAV
jgi:CMP-N,N'-diacetyllegionaminic acid synthase